MSPCEKEARRLTRNPCVKRCGFTGGLCRGCLRTRSEVKGWKHLPDMEKVDINRRVGAALAAVAGAKKARKLQKKIAKLERKLEALREERAGLAAASLEGRVIRLVVG